MVVGGSPVLAAGANDEIGEEAMAGGGGSVGESDGQPTRPGSNAAGDGGACEGVKAATAGKLMREGEKLGFRSQLLPDLYLLDPSDLDPIVERRGELESRIEVMRRGRGVGKELKIQGRSDRESSPLIG
uniref:Uncharacterized protein n=2 Tax=Oryza sativa subsp. japonica TaxID=39947 RepID=Q10KG4_ORYSJ|nr:hypothetical protein [Oryza sativa Japonica Group]ABF96305.1 hypothetical protein LOC_Os03g26830 [Oryza sativa Japonica Group]